MNGANRDDSYRDDLHIMLTIIIGVFGGLFLLLWAKMMWGPPF